MAKNPQSEVINPEVLSESHLDKIFTHLRNGNRKEAAVESILDHLESFTQLEARTLRIQAAVRKAIAEGELAHANNIKAQAFGEKVTKRVIITKEDGSTETREERTADWRASRYILERRFREAWGEPEKPEPVQGNVNVLQLFIEGVQRGIYDQPREITDGSKDSGIDTGTEVHSSASSPPGEGLRETWENDSIHEPDDE